MNNLSINLHFAMFRNRIWAALIVFSCFFLSSCDVAQQPTATIERQEDSGSVDESNIDVQNGVVDGGVINKSEGDRCGLFMSHGGWATEGAANSALAEIVFEITLNDVLVQPVGSMYVGGPYADYPKEEWHVHQQFQTDVLQIGDYQVIVTYNKPLGKTVKSFSIHVE